MEYINGNQKGQISRVYDFPIAAITNYYKQWLKTTQFFKSHNPRAQKS